MQKFKNIYRIESTRFKSWNYSEDGLYYITICAYNRQKIFGIIENQEMVLSDLGIIINKEWNKSFEIRKELLCHAFVIMPNHLHAMLQIIQTNETHSRASLQKGIAFRSPKSISSFIAGFKSSATKRINEFRNLPNEPVWQTRFFDHIVRNDKEYRNILDYINGNPAHWKNDEFY